MLLFVFTFYVIAFNATHCISSLAADPYLQNHFIKIIMEHQTIGHTFTMWLLITTVFAIGRICTYVQNNFSLQFPKTVLLGTSFFAKIKFFSIFSPLFELTLSVTIILQFLELLLVLLCWSKIRLRCWIYYIVSLLLSI